jgi:hypothetical protein
VNLLFYKCFISMNKLSVRFKSYDYGSFSMIFGIDLLWITKITSY